MLLELNDYVGDMKRCARCSICKWPPLAQMKSWRFSQNCPSIARYNFYSYSGGGRMALGLALAEGKLDDVTDELLNIVYRCTSCGACDSSCKYNSELEVLWSIYSTRAHLVSMGNFLPEHLMIIESLRKEDNTMMQPKADRAKWAEGLNIRDLSQGGQAEVIYHAGCLYCYDPDLSSIARDAVTLLKQTGIDLGIMGSNETCCGSMAFQLGFQGEFIKFAESNIDDWNAAGAKRVVTSCACGFGIMKAVYPLLGKEMKFEVLHITQILDELIKEGKLQLSKSIPARVTYHDPCNLGRNSEQYVPWRGVEKKVLGQFILREPEKVVHRGWEGVYEPPRDIIRRVPGIELVEMERIREYSWCCGAGSGVKLSMDDFALWTASERIKEAKSVAAEAIVTACPWCERNFKDAIAQSGDHLMVYDIVELVKQAL
ncbi:MAG TPA: (Fe-S)-binding protein [Dehalococcoidia bacterium]|nr:(Fe-S)-binding protein [Dehalococcoidia bacterium]